MAGLGWNRSPAGAGGIANAIKSTQAGIETLLGTPEAFQAMLETETVRWGKVVKAAGIKPE